MLKVSHISSHMQLLPKFLSISTFPRKVAFKINSSYFFKPSRQNCNLSLLRRNSTDNSHEPKDD